MKSDIPLAIKKTFLLFFLSTLIFSLLYGQKAMPDSLIVYPFGKVYIYKQSDNPQNVIIMISGDTGWNYGVPEFARLFSEMKTLVIGVDILRYCNALKERRRECYMVSPDFVELATAVEKKYNFERYVPPVLMGYSSGATFVYGILAQARPGTFIGGISLGFCPELDLPKMFCQINGLTGKTITEGKRYLLIPDTRLGNPWIVLQGKKDKICDLITVTEFVKKTDDAELIVISETGHDFSKMSDFMPHWKGAYNKLLSIYQASQTAKAPVSALSRIPYTITRETTEISNGPIALFFSGDGGWYGFEQIIADKLAAEGIPTIGIDVKRYLWNRRTPEETANDMEALLYYFGKEWNKTKILVIGYSQGAEMVPFVANRLPEILKSNIVSAVMLSPETTTDFEIHISNMLGFGSRQNKLSVIDEILKMKNIPALCIFGENEKNPVPGLLKASPVKIAFIPGDHHYRLNETLIVQTMKEKNAFEIPSR